MGQPRISRIICSSTGLLPPIPPPLGQHSAEVDMLIWWRLFTPFHIRGWTWRSMNSKKKNPTPKPWRCDGCMSVLWRMVPDPTALPGALVFFRDHGSGWQFPWWNGGVQVIPPGSDLQLQEYPSEEIWVSSCTQLARTTWASTMLNLAVGLVKEMHRLYGKALR